MNPKVSSKYIDLLERGPFPGQIDPWAEAGRYFQQIHAGMIGNLLDQIKRPLLEMGYVAGRETSLQIAERRQPDIFVKRSDEIRPVPAQSWDYVSAAAEIVAEPGDVLELDSADFHALFIREVESSALVAVVEIISPRNKTDQLAIEDYQERRMRLLRRDVNVVEIDLTRSVKRLVADSLVTTYAYHIVVYLPQQTSRLIGIDYGHSLKRVALPLRGEVLPMELQDAYDYAYRAASIAVHIHSEGHYIEGFLPFSTLLSDDQRRAALETVAAWQAQLASESQ